MKKALCLLAILAALLSGFALGKMYALRHAELFVVELPERNASGGFDEEEITVFLEIDNQSYKYDCTIG